jgi:formylglycine-generating enzyme required for sulfatase activity
VGSPYDTVGGIAQRGSVAVFTRSGAGWVMHDRLAIAGGTAASRCGTAVAGLSDAVIVGAPKHTPPAGGTVRVFESPVQTLAWATTLEAMPDPNVVTDATLRTGIIATGLPWRVRDNASQIELLLVPPGTFEMGCIVGSNEYECYSWEQPVHQVSLTNGFYLGRYEVTQSQWVARMGSNPSHFQSASAQVPASEVPNRPVEQVSWSTVQGFLMSTSFRLPTEAEWEYACRAGTQTPFYNGSADDSTLGMLAWYDDNSSHQTHPVGGKAANALGFHDMLGNVFEWVNDAWERYTAEPQTNPTGSVNESARVIRGGAWSASSFYGRSSFRFYDSPQSTVYGPVGFRVARNP